MFKSLTLTTTCLASALLAGPALADPELPDFGGATFSPGVAVDHPYFPLTDTLTRVYVDQDLGEEHRFELTVLGPGPVILGVQTTTQRDRAYEDGLLVEDTFDYYAQDTAGNVWYFGEDVTNFEYDDDGNLLSTNSHSSWRAGENFANPGGDPAKPGFIMPANPTVGHEYFQEFAPDDEATDVGENHAFVSMVSLGIGDFEDVLQVLETNPLDPDARGFKYFAPGFGLLFEEEDLDINLENPGATVVLTRVVPEPATAGLVLLCGAGWAACRRRMSRV